MEFVNDNAGFLGLTIVLLALAFVCFGFYIWTTRQGKVLAQILDNQKLSMRFLLEAPRLQVHPNGDKTREGQPELVKEAAMASVAAPGPEAAQAKKPVHPLKGSPEAKAVMLKAQEANRLKRQAEFAAKQVKEKEAFEAQQARDANKV